MVGRRTLGDLRKMDSIAGGIFNKEMAALGQIGSKSGISRAGRAR